MVGNCSQEGLSTELKGHPEKHISLTIRRMGGREIANSKMKAGWRVNSEKQSTGWQLPEAVWSWDSHNLT